MPIFTIVIELLVVALISILADRFLSTKAAVIVLCVCLPLLGYLHRGELKMLFGYKTPIAKNSPPPQSQPQELPKTDALPTDDSKKPISRADLLKMLQQFPSSESAFANVSNERLNEITKFTVFGLEELGDTWQGDDADTDRGVSELIRFTRFADDNGGSRSMNEIEIAKIRRDANQRKAANHVKLRTEGKDLIVQACDLRIEIVHNRLSWQLRDRQADSKQDALFARLRTSNYDWKDVSQAHDYLSILKKELEAQPRL